jgi:hypothetical protein
LVVPQLISSGLKLRLSSGCAAQDLPQAQAFDLQVHLKNSLKNDFSQNFTKIFNLNLTHKLLFGII